MKERLALESVAVPYRKRGWWSGKSNYASVSSEPQVFLFHPCNVTHRSVFRTFIQPTWNGLRKKEKGKERRTKPSTLVVMATCTISIRAAITYRPGNCPARLQLSRKKGPCSSTLAARVHAHENIAQDERRGKSEREKSRTQRVRVPTYQFTRKLVIRASLCAYTYQIGW